MEDISRELEREIARSKPKPYKQDRKTRVLIIDDFGKITPGEYLKTLVRILSVISIVCCAAAVLFYLLYTGLFKDAVLTKDKLVLAEKKVENLTQEKEVLMARLVISGKEPGIKKDSQKGKKAAPLITEIEEKKPLVSKKEEIKPIPPEPEDEGKKEQLSLNDKGEKTTGFESKNLELKSVNIPLELSELPPKAKISETINKPIDIENFTVKKDGTNGDLLVRFDIRNISTEPGDVSGRIFTVLKPDHELEDQWLVVPRAALKEGVPSEYKKGQYFSIAHFKPVKFRIKNQADPDFFKTASIFIFNEQADLIFEKVIDITEAE